MFTSFIFLIFVVVLFLLIVNRSPLWLWAVAMVIPLLAWNTWGSNGIILNLPLFLLIIPIIFGFLSIPLIRRFIFIGPLFRTAKKMAPKISSIEKQAIDAGTKGFDSELFSGTPDWDAFRSINKIELSREESDFLKGATQELCKISNDWTLRKKHRQVTKKIWNFVRQNGFLGLRVSKDAGGRNFSAQAQSIILGTVASRSIDTSIIAEVPNSLGPDELIEEYGTDEQKKKYLSRFVSGEEVPCFAITSDVAGSDIGSMQDVGFVENQKIDGQEVLGIRLSWSKRYITLAPEATLIVLAFHLYDNEKLLGYQKDLGITLALIPTKHPGVKIGRRHLPSGTVFPNGPISGENVFVPLEWVIGGKDGIGQGWKMVMQSLATGRSISIPSMSVATIKFILLVSTAYTRIRRQFNKPIAKIEGVEEALARITEAAYVTEAARAVTSAMVDGNTRPLVIASMMKYRMTEYARRAVNDAMDIHGGKGVMDGPSNYLQSAYQMAPVAITVEGSNIITRSLIVVGQAVLRSHPYYRDEFEALQETPKSLSAIKKFDNAVLAHASLLLSNGFLSIFHNFTRGYFAHSGSAPKEIAFWYRELSKSSKMFAFLADLIILSYRGKLKKKQKISGRIADALSELYLLSCVLKRYEDDGCHKEDLPIVELCMKNGLSRFDDSLFSLINNIKLLPIRVFLRFVTFPFGRTHKPANDALGTIVVQTVINPGDPRDRLTRYTYIPQESDPVGLLEKTFKRVVDSEDLISRIEAAVKSGNLKRDLSRNLVQDAQDSGLITTDEGKELLDLYKSIKQIIAVDDFDFEEVLNNYA